MFDVTNGVVIVTGGGGGIGRSLALRVALRGARVAVADIDPVRAKAVADEIGDAAQSFFVDVTDPASVTALATNVLATFGQVNALFNHTGVYVRGPLDKAKPEDIDWLIDVNIRGAIACAIAFIPALKAAAERGEPAYMVNTGSENSISLPPRGAHTVYSATKHAMFGLTDGLRRDLVEAGVEVFLFCPGVVQTDIWNARRVRPERFGGAREQPPELSQMLSRGRTAEETVDTVFEGLDAGEFLIITDPRMRSYVDERLDMVKQALDRCEARVRLPAAV